MTRNVLILTSDAASAVSLSESLSAGGYESVHIDDVDAVVDYLGDHDPGLCLSDVDGAERLLCEHRLGLPPLVVVDSEPDLETAVSLVRRGARDYIGSDHNDLLAKTDSHYCEASAGAAIFASPASKRCAELARRVARTDVSVLVTGESGTGKEVIARLIHEHSDRSRGPFIAINCAAIPENMLEAMLFGHVKGAFTGAVQSQPGKFELAHGGTLLLDEVSEMPLALQAKLLRVLQEREVERLGGRAPIAVDVRVIATTNVDVKKAISDGTFREDLYYRLSVFPLSLHPLRERSEDVALLAEHFVNKHGARLGRQNVCLGVCAVKALKSYRWPGNVRELENVIQRVLVLTGGAEIRAEDLDLPIVVEERDDSLRDQREEAEAAVIIEALRANNNRRKATAEQLGISERTLRYKMKRLKEIGVMEY